VHLQQQLDVMLALVLEHSPPQEPLLPVQVRLLVRLLVRAAIHCGRCNQARPRE
jgi:hypothetical protein